MKTKTIDEKRQMATLNGVSPKSQVQGVAAAWLFLKWASRMPDATKWPAFSNFQTLVNDQSMSFFNRVFVEWNPSLLKDLASEMERLKPETWGPDMDTLFLLAASELEATESGRVNLTKLAQHIARLQTKDSGLSKIEITALIETKAKSVLRRLRRKAHAVGVDPRGSGRPNN